MKKEDVYQHPLRLSLNNPEHLKLHKQLLNVNKDIYKSKNDFMVRKLYEGVFGDEKELTGKTLKELEDKITVRVVKELLQTIFSVIGTGMDTNKMEVPTRAYDSRGTDIVSDSMASVALDYFDD